MKLAVSAAVLVVVLASVWLGSWQWDRYEAKAERKDRVEQHYSADPVPVTEVLTSEPVPSPASGPASRRGASTCPTTSSCATVPATGSTATRCSVDSPSRTGRCSSSTVAGCRTPRRGPPCAPTFPRHRAAR